MLKTYKYRIKDKNRLKLLDQMSREVKFAWNVLNSASRKKWKESRKYFHKYDPYFTNIFKGASNIMLLNAQSFQAIADQFHQSLWQHRKQLRFRGLKTQGWIPFKSSGITFGEDYFKYGRMRFRYWKSRPFPKGSKLKCGCFSQDKLGRWYVSFVIEYDEKLECGRGVVGIDLGLKVTATTSNKGEYLSLKYLEKINKDISRQQKAKNNKRVKKLYMYQSNKRKDDINKFVFGLVNRNNRIAIGKVTNLCKKGHMAKSRTNNAWSLFKRILIFKCIEYNVNFKEISEYLTTQTCNDCGHVGGPKGVKELGVREWICCNCGRTQQRDICSARNIRDWAWE